MGRQVGRTDKAGGRIDRKISGEKRRENEMRKIGEKTTSRRSGLEYRVKTILRWEDSVGKQMRRRICV